LQSRFWGAILPVIYTMRSEHFEAPIRQDIKGHISILEFGVTRDAAEGLE